MEFCVSMEVVMPKENEPGKPWQAIAEALIREQNPEKASELADVLDRAIDKKLNRENKPSKKKEQGSAASH
jgi:hypothetical protein